MNNYDFIGPLGVLTGVFFAIALLNFFVKLINKKYINKLGKDKKQFVDYYRKFMKLIIKYHKLAGTIATICLLAHFSIAYLANWILPSGIIAALILVLIFGFGIYGAYISKNMKANWLKVHRILAFALLFAVIFHII